MHGNPHLEIGMKTGLKTNTEVRKGLNQGGCEKVGVEEERERC